MNELIFDFLIIYSLPLAAFLISILSFYYSALRGAKVRIEEVERIYFYPRFDSEGTLVGVDFEVPIVIINDGLRIGVLSDLHLVVAKPLECAGRIRTEQEMRKLPCAVENQGSIVFEIRTGSLPIKPKVKYEIKIIGKTAGKEIHSSFEFLLDEEDWEIISNYGEYYTLIL